MVLALGLVTALVLVMIQVMTQVLVTAVVVAIAMAIVMALVRVTVQVTVGTSALVVNLVQELVQVVVGLMVQGKVENEYPTKVGEFIQKINSYGHDFKAHVLLDTSSTLINLLILNRDEEFIALFIIKDYESLDLLDDEIEEFFGG